MSSTPIRRSGPAPTPDASAAKKPAASVRDVPRGDFVSIHSRSVLLDKLEEIANLANEATSADGVAIALREGDQYLCRASLGFAPELGVAVRPGEGTCGQCLAESRLVLAQDLPGEVKSALAAPVVVSGKVQGLIAVFSFRAGAFAASHSELLCCLASDIAEGLDSLDSIHLVTRESMEFAPHREPELQPTTRDERLAILEAVTAPSLPNFSPILESSNAGVVEPVLQEPQATTVVDSGFHFMGYTEATADCDFEEETVSRRPFRNHWDVVIILAAILIAALTFGIWLRHRQSQPYRPYTGQLTNPASASLALDVHESA
ncbi:MAG TPA: GAF domain-containing protein [Terriglobales bacterium]|nr:GAF domain-containing protein [Terriglobales bacterium]